MLRTLTICILLIASLDAAAANEWRFDDADRVVAISDVHGALDAMLETLQRADVVDENRAWVGGKTNLVIVGDILDRGPSSRAVMDLLMRLETEASAAGGAVRVVIGNHESMNLIGDLRYVSKAEYAAFAGDETPEQRERWFAAYAKRNGVATSDEALRQKFEQRFPAGFFALRRAFRPDGEYGRWLLEKPVIAVVNGTAFVHGGLSPLVARLGLEGVNIELKNELIQYVEALQTLTDAGVLLPSDSHYDTYQILNAYLPALDETPETLAALQVAKRLGQSDLFDSDGPLWYRGNVSCGTLMEAYRVDAALAALSADRVVVGHTPTPMRRIQQRFDGRLIEIDTGMLNFYYKGSGNALILSGDSVSVINQSGDGPGEPLTHPRGVGVRPGMISADELHDLLRDGQILSQEKQASGASVVKVAAGDVTVSAIFSKRQGRGFYPDAAAYRLDRLLKLDMVPVTALRRVNGIDGSLQFLADKRSDEATRSTSGAGAGAQCPLEEQWQAMYVFDVLIYNQGRSLQRMLYDTTTWRLMLSQHDLAFANKRGRPKHLVGVSLDLSEGWRRALGELTAEVLAENLGDVLDRRRLSALIARRGQLLRDLEQRQHSN